MLSEAFQIIKFPNKLDSRPISYFCNTIQTTLCLEAEMHSKACSCAADWSIVSFYKPLTMSINVTDEEKNLYKDNVQKGGGKLISA